MMQQSFVVQGVICYLPTDGDLRPKMARPAMTLVELIVVIAIIGLLSGLVLAFWPGVQEQQRAATAASMFEGWLRLAKSRALGDQRVRGLRLILNTPTVNGNPNSLWVTQCQLLNQPDDFYIQGYNAAVTGTTIFFGSAATGLAAPGGGGSVASVQMLSGGNGYSPSVPGSLPPTPPPPLVFFSQPPLGGTQATGKALVDNNGQVSIAIVSPGSGYITPPTVTIAVPPIHPVGAPSSSQFYFLPAPVGPPIPPVLDFYQGNGPAESGQSLWEVQPLDYLEVNGNGQLHLITGVLTVNQFGNAGPSNAGTGLSLQPIVNTPSPPGMAPILKGATMIPLTSTANLTIDCHLDLFVGSTYSETVRVTGLSWNSTPPPMGSLPVGPYVTVAAPGVQNPYTSFTAQSHGLTNFGPGSTFRIVRAPRVAADELLQLPSGLVIDLNTNKTYGNLLPLTQTDGVNTSLDILFSPSGTVVTPGVSTNFLALWVRDLNLTGTSPAGQPYFNFPSQAGAEFLMGPTIIAVWTNSGLIAAHPPNDAGGNPYQFVMDGRAQ